MRPLAIFDKTVWRGHSCPRNARSKITFSGNLFRSLSICFSTFLICAALALTPNALAQRATAGGHSALHSSAGHSSRARNGYPSARRNSPLLSPLTSLPFPFFGDSFDPDDIYSTGYPVASAPPPFLMQALQGLAGSATGSIGSAMSVPNNREPSSNQPLMIELQNGRYVRVNIPAIDGEALPLSLPTTFEPAKSPHPHTTKLAASASTQPLLIAAASPAPALPAAVLVFRDGHSEEVRDYTIADGILYARGDYYTDGYWNKKIDLATLNVGQTLQANADRNVKFVLPSSANEVITRP
jgi:hypothetical protein